MQDLIITCVQSDLKWQDKKHNLAHFKSLLGRLTEKPDLVVLPEMFSTGFSMQAELLAETMDGPTVEWMSGLARGLGSAVCGSLIIKEGGRYFNRFIWADGQNVLTYDKRHLFSLLDEGLHYTPGRQHTLIQYRGWNIQPFICYDLRFPAWCRSAGDADLQIYVANWPERRIAHWSILLKARAIENQCYTVGVNRIGMDNNNIPHTGESGIYDPYGNELARYPDEEAVFTRTLSAEALQKCRQNFPFLKDRDNFEFRDIQN